MPSVTLLFTFAFILATLFQYQASGFVLPKPRKPPLVHSIASRGTSRQVNAFLNAHNSIRSAHFAAPLRWSNDLAAKAESYGDRCPKQHSGGSLDSRSYGENIAAGTGNFTIDGALQSFISDQNLYDPVHPTYRRFTQVVWKSTQEIGCASSECKDYFPGHGKTTVYTCLYFPAGNVIGQLR
ncbi:CAP domain-containing protein [Crepidotus variabilis]|uniref:CAP domain-containing protein n=1 Tax=Crepidotus variabilis TaxID=179855 RepID=A0A9P6ESZ1_9AGAR|nr:CAP domain-containing protein [Crepidotus variabilis]